MPPLKSVEKLRAPRNRSLVLTKRDHSIFTPDLIRLNKAAAIKDVLDSTLNQDLFEVLDFLPASSVDLLFVDPPYNLDKTFNGRKFSSRSIEAYENWLSSWLIPLKRILKPTASLYLCGDWRSSTAIERVASEHFIIRNRITWEREKGRGAKTNWKNACEDIWFCTVGEDYTFNLDDVKIKRKVLAPYTDETKKPKDWQAEKEGRFRLTHPSNLWTDLTVPFWSMPENTDHPTQKPEKLLARIILASSNPGDVVLDPFLGSGTTSVAAKKLHRHYIGIDIDETYCLLTQKRLALAEEDKNIQGYTDGVFYERNSLASRTK